jgi:hypothetical protein
LGNLTEKVDLFLSLLRDADLGARRQAVLTLNALARANIETIPGTPAILLSCCHPIMVIVSIISPVDVVGVQVTH